ncbi:dTDP-glucose 4,6-dehydratase [Devosia sp. BK]|nr:dTDP-glucose 4,6-dehydratase [Devosia sp. BK]MDV3253793.1 dTDP-glucose 4,6-dehydratase [Devosia sp. BK]
MSKNTVLVTGGYGFIGSALVRRLVGNGHVVINVDKLTYSSNFLSLKDIEGHPGYLFEQGDICDSGWIAGLLETYKPEAIINLAAETHVDRSIDGPDAFVRTNILGTYALLEAARRYSAVADQNEQLLFIHVSTDEVFGDLGPDDAPFSERTPYAPSSPYSASKAASDHLVKAWGRTYGLSTIVTNCSNNYGPRQFPEKLLPHMILNALAGRPLPVYGDGNNIRDWLYVEDHASALEDVLLKGRSGESYLIGGNNEVRNIDLVRAICRELDAKVVHKPEGVGKFEDLITFVKDRPGHDTRYAIDATKVRDELGWEPKESLSTGLAKTIEWYLNNPEWLTEATAADYNLERLGLGKESL